LNEINVGRQLPLVVERKGRLVELQVAPRREDDQVLLGVALVPAATRLCVGHVRPGSPAAKAGILPDAEITSVDGENVNTWAELYARLRDAGGAKVTIGWTLDGAKHTAEAGPLTKEVFDPADYQFLPQAIAGMLILRTPVVRGNPVQALAWSVRDTGQWMASVYKTLRALLVGRASFKGLSGPVGIGADAVIIGREGVTDLAYFMAMISALVAVFNVLPLPVLDGGQVVYVIIEKIRGEPLPVKAVAAIQSIGWMRIPATAWMCASFACTRTTSRRGSSKPGPSPSLPPSC
jgi:regulator of sigma E protease